MSTTCHNMKHPSHAPNSYLGIEHIARQCTGFLCRHRQAAEEGGRHSHALFNKLSQCHRVCAPRTVLPTRYKHTVSTPGTQV